MPDDPDKLRLETLRLLTEASHDGGGVGTDGGRLRDGLSRAIGTYPLFQVPRDAFLQHVATVVAEQASSSEQLAPILDKTRLGDLYLACACTMGIPAAIATFESTFMGDIDVVARRFPRSALSLDEVRQRLREKLLGSRPPGIARYAGRGDLRGWVRAAALHLMLNATSRESRERPTEDHFFDAVIDANPSIEKAFVARNCRDELKKALSSSLEKLNPRERNLLRYAFAEELNVEELGAIYGVHRATAARWVVKAKDRLWEQTRAELSARLRIDLEEAESILRAALSSVGSTIIRFEEWSKDEADGGI